MQSKELERQRTRACLYRDVGILFAAFAAAFLVFIIYVDQAFTSRAGLSALLVLFFSFVSLFGSHLLWLCRALSRIEALEDATAPAMLQRNSRSVGEVEAEEEATYDAVMSIIDRDCVKGHTETMVFLPGPSMKRRIMTRLKAQGYGVSELGHDMLVVTWKVRKLKPEMAASSGSGVTAP